MYIGRLPIYISGLTKRLIDVDDDALDAVGLARRSMTDLEIGFFARNAEEWDRLVAALNAFRRIAHCRALRRRLRPDRNRDRSTR